ncbi:site-specific integrase [Vagococcus sp. BWB3-3]|uniref:Site-specific integrase n=1 Tax=Vagococcus allomyrinae TaxID=2794353 RepID=A0A940P618_9ENTE|nr:site-specific integrase [Vagococcus allomyrinae]MBP1040411.1 site-specific integrase [Vagococcus allomyrinae]
MATFRKRGKNWEYRIRYVDQMTGKTKEKSKGGFKTKELARYEASQVTIDLKDGFIERNENITISNYLDVWFESYKPTVKETSWRNRENNTNILKAKFGETKLKKLNHNFYQKAINELSKNYAYNTLISINQVAQMMAKHAVRDSYFKFNPIADIKIPHYDNEDEQILFLETQEITIFKNYCIEDINKKRKLDFIHVKLEKERELAIYYLMLYGGLRVGEACALQLSDYYPITKEINISKTLASKATSQTNDTYTVYPPKTKNAYRTIPLPEIAYKQLEKWLRLRKEYKLKFSAQFEEQCYIFPKKNGSPFTPRDIRTKLDVIMSRLDGEITRITPHGLRHTYTALLIQADTNVKHIQALLGHASIKTTLDIYAHITGDKKQESIANFDKMLKNLG